MLRFSANSPLSTPVSRRDFLRIGVLGLDGLTLADQLAMQGALAVAGSVARHKSVIFLFMHGGPSQFETFAPKMDAPSEIRCVTGEIPTSIPGITFDATFPKLARLADEFSIVRSFVTGDSIYDLKSIAGKHTLNAKLGSLSSRIAGSMNRETAMPSNITLLPMAVAPEAGPQIL